LTSIRENTKESTVIKTLESDRGGTRDGVYRNNKVRVQKSSPSSNPSPK
jgi:hypothetical protein